MITNVHDYLQMLGGERLSGSEDIYRIEFSERAEGRAGTYHGGVTTALLESAAHAFAMAVSPDHVHAPLSMTITFLRPTGASTLFAAALLSRQTKRLLRIKTIAWQADREKPVAEARWLFLRTS